MGIFCYLRYQSNSNPECIGSPVHRTDDDEFFIPRVLAIRSEEELLDEAMGYMYYYNNVREHSSLDYQTPFAILKKQMPDLFDSIRYTIPILLDDAAVNIGPWSGYNVLAQNLVVWSKFRRKARIRSRWESSRQ